MSKEEEEFHIFLKSKNIHSERQKEVSGCPFTARGKHKVDFYIPSKDLYIEIKGMMSYGSVSIFRFLREEMKLNIVLLQMNDENWMGRFDDIETRQSKRERMTRTQFDEIVSVCRGRIPVADLVARSEQRLEEYIRLQNGSPAYWAACLRTKNTRRNW